jgi:hypothetical protein
MPFYALSLKVGERVLLYLFDYGALFVYMMLSSTTIIEGSFFDIADYALGFPTYFGSGFGAYLGGYKLGGLGSSLGTSFLGRTMALGSSSVFLGGSFLGGGMAALARGWFNINKSACSSLSLGLLKAGGEMLRVFFFCSIGLGSSNFFSSFPSSFFWSWLASSSSLMRAMNLW